MTRSQSESATEDPIVADASGAPLELFDRWEQQQWSVADFALTDDRAGWISLGPYTQKELRSAIENFLVGESAVTETLPPLVHAAPTPQEQLFLATQLADEARHAVLFARYLSAVENTPELTFAVMASDNLTDMLDGALREATATVRQTPQDRDAWYRSIVVYHLLVEGVLAVSGMRTLLTALKGLPELPVLAQALTNVARDESRHIGFGVGALRAGVASGHGVAVAQALRELVPPAARALVDPSRCYPRIAPHPVQRQLAMELERIWGLAERALIGRAERIGLNEESCDAVRSAWGAGLKGALDEYEERHGSAHPARRATDPQPEPLERA
jgi:ribonucleoside-diphosphate reductase beta chain